MQNKKRHLMDLKAFDSHQSLIFLCLALVSCVTQSNVKKAAAQNETSVKEIGQNLNSDSNESSLGKKNLPFPRSASRHATHVMLLTSPQPPASQIHSCLEQIHSIGLNSLSQEDMVLSRNNLVSVIEANLPLYHFCFFNLISQLDQRLEEGGALITHKAPLFIDGMRSLWILGTALDIAEDHDQYFIYLKRRYLQLSESVFGRQLETIGVPMGNLRFDLDKMSPNTSSPALKKPVKK